MAAILTKGEIVQFALRKFAVASNATLTSVEPQSEQDGISDLEDMMSELVIMLGDIGYSFSADGDDPLPDDEAGIPRKYKMAIGYRLLLRMMSDYEVQPTANILTHAKDSWDALLTDTLVIPSIQRRADQPQGQGNKTDRYIGDRFYTDPDSE